MSRNETEDLIPQLARVEDAFGVAPAGKSARARLRHLVAELHEHTGFFTGVTKFSKVSLFSDVNDLIELSLDPSHAAICGYTDADLDTTFAAEPAPRMKEPSAGEREGLDIHGRWEWYVRHPVLRLDLSGSFRTPAEVEQNLLDQFADIAEQAGIAIDASTAAIGLRQLIRRLRRRADKRVVLLIDEYDKPILDALATPTLARANRDLLHGVYSIIKACDADLEFVLLTGVSRFSKVSLFSGLNNLADITLDKRYSSLCGYTDAELDAVFADQLAGLDRQAIRDWYDGYNWLGDESVYNLPVRVQGGALRRRRQRPRPTARAQLRRKHRRRNCPIHLVGVEFSKETRTVVGFEVETV